eukprot:gnl/Dysnectes_brevis/965_a1075_1879.p1 GENE.gnl/Dysnectes_brevis/965_a1075_1879~~gnl/Dysnectes_brevis/965_a1075_1879.p1  ORF type:complete len:485 (+),score=99.26 gnl/Dysnectes_brevis/965_a1075_1879:60-1457(+)
MSSKDCGCPPGVCEHIIEQCKSLELCATGLPDHLKQHFSLSITTKAIKIKKRFTSQIMKVLGSSGYKSIKELTPQLPIVQTPTDDPDSRLVVLHPQCDPSIESTILSLSSISPPPAIVPHTLRLRYPELNRPQIFDAVFPADITPPQAFEQIGHIAHFNLRSHLLPYKHFIGAVVLDTSVAVRTVVNKSASISDVFRVFPMELIGGELDTITQHKEEGAIFKMDFAKVYWNSRLSAEHRRVADDIPRGTVVADMFGGIGPFAVPCALRGCTVHCNDLNPESYRWMTENVAANRLEKSVDCYNLDGRDFIVDLEKRGVPFTRVIMNLPAIAISFLDSLREVCRPGIIAHVHCFTRAASSCPRGEGWGSELDVGLRCGAVLRPALIEEAGALGVTVAADGSSVVYEGDAPDAAACARLWRVVQRHVPGISVRQVRLVAPNKMMCCARVPIPVRVPRSPAKDSPPAKK